MYLHLFSSKIAREITTNKHVALNAGRNYFYIWPSSLSCGYPCLLTPCQQNLFLMYLLDIFTCFRCLFPLFSSEKILKCQKEILTNRSHAKHLFAGWNTQQMVEASECRTWIWTKRPNTSFVFWWFSKTIPLDNRTAFRQLKTELAWYLDPLWLHILLVTTVSWFFVI